MVHTKINRKIENSTPCNIVTHKDFNVKLGTRDCVQLLGRIGPVGASPKRNITHCDFCYPVFFLAHAPRSNRRTDSYAEWLKRRVSAKGRSFGGGVMAMGNVIWGNMLKNTPKRGMNRQFQAKTPKSIHRNISGTITQTNKRFEDRVQTTKRTSWVVRHYPKANTTWLMADILKIDLIFDIWFDISAVDDPIWMKFGSPMQNNAPITAK